MTPIADCAAYATGVVSQSRRMLTMPVFLAFESRKVSHNIRLDFVSAAPARGHSLLDGSVSGASGRSLDSASADSGSEDRTGGQESHAVEATRTVVADALRALFYQDFQEIPSIHCCS